MNHTFGAHAMTATVTMVKQRELRVAAMNHDAALDSPLERKPGRPRKALGPKPTLRQVARGNRLSLAMVGGR